MKTAKEIRTIDFDDCTLWLNNGKATLEEVNKYVDNLKQENEKLKAKLDKIQKYCDYRIKNIRCNTYPTTYTGGMETAFGEIKNILKEEV